jgi:hypothetical protein
MGCGVKIFRTSLFTLPESLDQPLHVHGHSLEVIIERRKAVRDSRDGRRFEELRTQSFELRIVPFSPISRFTRHGLSPLADCFSILREQRMMEEPDFLTLIEI